MRLYVVMNKKTGEVDSHTRDKEAFDKYIKTLNKSKFKTLVLDTDTCPKKEKEMTKEYIRRIEEDYVEQTLSFLPVGEDEVAREGDIDIHSFAVEEFAKLKMVKKDLKNIVKNYDISKEEKKKLKKALEVIDEISKPKRFDKAIGYHAIRDIVKNSPLIDLKRIFNIKGIIK